MKIAIFGDSYADPYVNVERKWGISWARLLAENYNYKIENFGMKGSNLWWSYEKFLENYEKFDQIIFVVTAPGRLSSIEKIDEGKHLHMPGLEVINFFEQNNKDNEFLLKIYHSMKDYFLYFQNDRQEEFLHNKTIEEIINKCNLNKKPLALIPAFKDSLHYQTIFKMPLSKINLKEQTINTGIDNEFVFEKKHTRANHMSKQNNEIFAQLVHEIIQGTRTSVTMDDFVFEKFPNPEDYWEI